MGSRLGLGGLLIGIVAVILLRMSNKSSAGEEYLVASKELVAQIPCYSANIEYVDWLVTQAHDECFSDSYTQEFGRRGRGGKVVVDEYGYLSDIFTHMINQAEADKATQVATELGTLRTEMFFKDP